MPDTTEPRHLDVLDAPARQVRINLDAGDLLNLSNGGTIAVVSQSPHHHENVEIYLTGVPTQEARR